MEEDSFIDQVKDSCANSNACSKVLSEAFQGETKWGRRRDFDGRTRWTVVASIDRSYGGADKQTSAANFWNQKEGYSIGRCLSATSRKENGGSSSCGGADKAEISAVDRCPCPPTLRATPLASAYHCSTF
jgi:hypothetical protein